MTESTHRAAIDEDRLLAMLDASGLYAPRCVQTVANPGALVSLVDGEFPVVVAEEVRDSGLASRAALWCAVAVDTSADAAGTRWATLIAALAASDAVAGIRVLIDWPANLAVQSAACGGAKGYGRLGTIDVARSDTGTDVVTLCINADISSRDLPEDDQTSLLSEGAELDRTALLGRYLIALARRRAQWTDSPTQIQRDYVERCLTIGRLDAEGRVIAGIDAAGELIIR